MKRLVHGVAGLAFFVGGGYLYGEGLLNGVEDFSRLEESQTTETLSYMAGSAVLFFVAGKECLQYVDAGREQELTSEDKPE